MRRVPLLMEASIGATLPNLPNISRLTIPRRVLIAIAQVLLALTLVIALMHYATGGRVAYTMDSLSYRDAALNFITGHPMQVTNVLAQQPEFQPLLGWPPAYPVLWASVASVGNADIDNVPSLLNPVLLGLTTLIIFWIGWMVTGRSAIACIVAIASAFAPPSMIVYGHAWSETLFIPTLLLAYAAFWKYRISREKFIWLAAAAILIGIANWIRYAGVAFFPILVVSVLAASGAVFGKRILHATGALILSVALVIPLWFHNWQLAGNISGATRGGAANTDRWIHDTAIIIDLLEHSLFAFSYMIRANLELPLAAAVIFVVITAFRRQGVQWLRPPEIWLPIVWFSGYLLFFLYARIIQKGIDLDLRTLAVAFPFLLLAITPAVNDAFSGRSFEFRKILTIFLLGLLIYSGLDEADRTRENYASLGVPEWRSDYVYYYIDMRNTSPTSRALQAGIGPIAPSTMILTDYRALYIRYLTGARVYSPYTKDCTGWTGGHAEGLILLRSPKFPPWAIDCLKENPQWRLLRPD
jgi:4-amino-4-deoxy-L-arabinose transferase-like glycosyltransferase